MKYSQNNTYYADFNTIKVNTLPARSYFIPFETKKATEVDPLLKRYSSKKVECLNGLWDFKYYGNPNHLELDFDTDKIKFDKLQVPSVWQTHGYDRVAYINTNWPFPGKPPVIPTTEPVGRVLFFEDGGFKFKKANPNEYNSIGLYRKIINLRQLKPHYIISFLGVCSCFELYCNGKFIGYAEESHNTHEFDLTDVLALGDNEIVVLVHKWCNGTYLEAQDMFRHNGIFRDVLLRMDNEIDLYDYSYKMTYHNGLYDLSVTATLNTKDEIDGIVRVGEHKNLVHFENGTARTTFKDLEVEEWNAEKPVTYDLEISIPDSYIISKIGFKHIEVKGDIYYFNNTPIKLRGVNHHDTSMTEGYYLKPEEIKRDLLLCKEYNMNTVRTSHYAPDPLLLELATIYGLYIVDECDLETHGCRSMVFPFSFNTISDNPEWKAHYMSRIENHYERDKALITPIIMWSLGNESGAGCNTDSTYEYIKSVSDIPVQYESAIQNKKIMAYDIASEMYPSTKMVEDVGLHQRKEPKMNDRPYFLCEYAHAMGVGPGDLEGYMKLFYKYPNIMGGCIWEMVDHTVLKDGKYTYGGDHGEWMHDKNFCCDGLFYPDRTPSTGAYITKHAYSPLLISYLGNHQFEFFNTLAFTNMSEYQITVIDKDIEYPLELELAPMEKKTLELDITDIDEDHFILFKVFKDNKDNKLVDETQIVLSEKIKTLDNPELVTLDAIQLNQNRVCINNVMIEDDLSTLLFRAGTDNDKHNFFNPTMPAWYNEKEVSRTVTKTDNTITIETTVKANKNTFKVVDMYQETSEGILLTSTISPIKVKGTLPRFAKVFRLPVEYTDVLYYGQESETYRDMKNQSKIGVYERKVNDMVEPNIKPQESGNRMDTRWCEVSNGVNTFRFEAIDEAYELAIKPYSDLDLSKMRHQEDAKNYGTYIAISKFQMGIGTGSCGPETKEEYTFDANKTYTLKVLISVK